MMVFNQNIFFKLLPSFYLFFFSVVFRKSIGPVVPYFFDDKLTQDPNVTSGLTPDSMTVNDLTYDQLVNKYYNIFSQL